jgi:hypothetical protein
MTALKDFCIYAILPECYDADLGYALCVMWQNVPGIYPSLFYCGHDLELAQSYVNELNGVNGVSPEVASTLLSFQTGLDKINFFKA